MAGVRHPIDLPEGYHTTARGQSCTRSGRGRVEGCPRAAARSGCARSTRCRTSPVWAGVARDQTRQFRKWTSLAEFGLHLVGADADHYNPKRVTASSLKCRSVSPWQHAPWPPHPRLGSDQTSLSSRRSLVAGAVAARGFIMPIFSMVQL
jgi:hypothetical protein